MKRALAPLLLALAGCGANIAETTTLPPKPLARSPSEQVIGVPPSSERREGGTPVAAGERR